MENKQIVGMGRTSLVKIIGALIFLCFFPRAAVFAYDPFTTHAALTQNIVQFYNLQVPSDSDRITDADMEAMGKGTIDEDIPPRWVNHFYDPIHNRGWNGIAAT